MFVLFWTLVGLIVLCNLMLVCRRNEMELGLLITIIILLDYISEKNNGIWWN